MDVKVDRLDFGERVAARVSDFIDNHAAAVGVSSVVTIVIALIVVATLFPVGMTAISTMNMTGWGETEQTIGGLLPVFAVLAVLMGIVGFVRMRR